MEDVDNARKINFDDVKDPSSPLYADISIGEWTSSDAVPTSTKTSMINLYCQKRRCQEEKELVLNEVKCLEAFLSNEILKLNDAADSLRQLTDRKSLGTLNLLLVKRLHIAYELTALHRTWSFTDDICIDLGLVIELMGSSLDVHDSVDIFDEHSDHSFDICAETDCEEDFSDDDFA